MVTFRSKLKKIVMLSTVASILGIFAGLFGFITLIRIGAFGILPSTDDLRNIQNHEASRVFSMDNVLIGTYFDQNRSNVPFSDIPEHTIHTLIATEDARFMQHQGVDYYAMVRVLVKSLLLGNNSAGGGSTISQQLAKNLYGRNFRYGMLSMAVNKIKEMTIASRIEEIYSKDEILALYLNTVSFGDNVYGIENASIRYFSKHCKQLTIAESAVIIGILKANTLYNPKINPQNSLKRRNTVLGQLHKYGYIKETEYHKLTKLPLGLKYKSSSSYLKKNGYFLEYVKQQAIEMLDAYNEENDTRYNLYTDGLQIETTLDKRLHDVMLSSQIRQLKKLQPALEKELRQARFWQKNADMLKKWKDQHNMPDETFNKKKPTLAPYFDQDTVLNLSSRDSLIRALGRLQSAILAADPNTGAIRAWIGGANFQMQPYDRIKAQRQVGSTFKPFVYYTALNRGLNPCKFIKNEQRTYSRYDDWSPANADGNHAGYYSVKGALANSVNTVTAEVLFRAGIEHVIETAQLLGIESELPEVPSIALGTASISLKEMVQAYCSFANLGYKQELYCIAAIKDKNGTVLYRHQTHEQKAVLDRTTTEELVTMMRAVVDQGTATRIRNTYGIQAQVAGKTGTTQNNTDGWFIGYTPKLVMGVWTGLDNPAIHFQTTRNGQGANTALPIWAYGFRKIEKSKFAKEYICDFPFTSPSYMDCELYRLDKPGLFENVFINKRSVKKTVKREAKKQGFRLFRRKENSR